jgi:hypothetical protein
MAFRNESVLSINRPVTRLHVAYPDNVGYGQVHPFESFGIHARCLPILTTVPLFKPHSNPSDAISIEA